MAKVTKGHNSGRYIWTSEWASRARAALAAREEPKEREVQWLAAQVGCTGPAISQLFDGAFATSRFIGAISDVLGITRPHAQVDNADDELALEALHDLRSLNPERYRRAMANLLSLARAERDAAASEDLDAVDEDKLKK